MALNFHLLYGSLTLKPINKLKLKQGSIDESLNKIQSFLLKSNFFKIYSIYNLKICSTTNDQWTSIEVKILKQT